MNRLEFIDDLDLDNGLLPPKPILRDEPVLTREFLINTVSRVFDVSPEFVSCNSRGPADACLARQVAMYLAHVACELSLTAVGQLFGRDRTTVAHACRKVEETRELDEFNRIVGMMERSVRAIVKTSSALQRDLALIDGGEI